MAENIKGTGRRRRHASNAETHRSRPAAKGKSKKGRTKRIVTTVISSLVALVLLAMLAVCVVFQHFYGMMTISDGRLDNSGTVVTPDSDTATEDNSSTLIYSDNVYNILLIGSDSREGSVYGLSDVMLLVSINRETKQLFMTSFLRDIYVDIPGYGPEKLNATNIFGGPALTIDTIEQYFEIDINAYAAIDFISFVDVVDSLGGVDNIELSESEIHYLNQYLPEINRLKGYPESSDMIYDGPGVYHLNGRQALAFCRNRYSDTDFGRTGRQREVLASLWDSLKDAGITELYSVASSVLPNVTTDLSQSDCVSLLMTVAQVRDYELISQAIPAEGTYTFDTINGMSVVSVDFDANKAVLRETIYGE